MPRKKLVVNNFTPYHVTARGNNREIFPLDLSSMWEIMTTELWILTVIYEIEIHAFVLMPNHFHLLLTVPSADLGKIMNLLMASVTTRANRRSGRSGHVFGGPYHWTMINSARYFGHALKYVYRNPVKGSLCKKVEDYTYSTLNGLVGNAYLPMPVFYTRAGMEFGLSVENYSHYLKWLNTSFSESAEILIQEGLRKKEFTKMICRKTRQAHPELERFI